MHYIIDAEKMRVIDIDIEEERFSRVKHDNHFFKQLVSGNFFL